MSRAAPSSVPVTPSSRISTVIPRPFLVSSFGLRLPQPTLAASPYPFSPARCTSSHYYSECMRVLPGS